jgi:hypothetical protein
MESEEEYEREGSGSRRVRHLWTRVGREQGLAIAAGHVVALPYAKSGGGALLLAMVEQAGAEQQAGMAAVVERHTAEAEAEAVLRQRADALDTVEEAGMAAVVRQTAEAGRRETEAEAEAVQEAEQQAGMAAVVRQTADAETVLRQRADAEHTVEKAGMAAVVRHAADAQSEAGAEPKLSIDALSEAAAVKAGAAAEAEAKGGAEAQTEPEVTAGPVLSSPIDVLVLGEATKVTWVTAPIKRSSQSYLGASECETVERIARRLGVCGGLGHRAAAFGTAQGLLLVGASGTGKVS